MSYARWGLPTSFGKSEWYVYWLHDGSDNPEENPQLRIDGPLHGTLTLPQVQQLHEAMGAFLEDVQKRGTDD